jgi:Protein of unknown function (DUF2612)
MKDVEQTIISQFANSPTILQLIHNMNAYIKPHADVENFLNTIWNVDTANLFGLAIWSRIVGLPQSLIAQLGTFLDDPDTFRLLVMLKALSNISISSAPSINQLLQNWIGGVEPRAYVIDTGNMTMVYNFEFALSAQQILILQTSGIFLRPAGVGATIQAQQFPVIGFAEQGQPFVTTMGNGVFSQGGISGVS